MPGLPQSEKYTSRCRFATYNKKYLVSKKHELAENGEGLEVLSEGPEEVAHHRSVQVRVEEHCQRKSQGDQVVGLDSVQVLVIADPVGDDNRVEDISREDGRDKLLNPEDDVSCSIVGEVALNSGISTLKIMKSTALMPNIKV